MKLIDEKEIESRTKGALAKYDVGFRCGVDFAEQKLLPMMVELIDVLRAYEVESHNLLGFDERTSQELLDIFLKTKQK